MSFQTCMTFFFFLSVEHKKGILRKVSFFIGLVTNILQNDLFLVNYIPLKQLRFK